MRLSRGPDRQIFGLHARLDEPIALGTRRQGLFQFGRDLLKGPGAGDKLFGLLIKEGEVGPHIGYILAARKRSVSGDDFLGAQRIKGVEVLLPVRYVAVTHEGIDVGEEDIAGEDHLVFRHRDQNAAGGMRGGGVAQFHGQTVQVQGQLVGEDDRRIDGFRAGHLFWSQAEICGLGNGPGQLLVHLGSAVGLGDDCGAKVREHLVAEGMVKVVVRVNHESHRFVSDGTDVPEEALSLQGRDQGVDDHHAALADNDAGIGPETVGRGGVLHIEITVDMLRNTLQSAFGMGNGEGEKEKAETEPDDGWFLHGDCIASLDFSGSLSLVSR